MLQVEHEILFAGREANVEPVSLRSLPTIVKAPKADLCSSPHDSWLPRQLLHQFEHVLAIGAFLVVLNAGKEFVNAGIILLCFRSCHGDRW